MALFDLFDDFIEIFLIIIFTGYEIKVSWRIFFVIVFTFDLNQIW